VCCEGGRECCPNDQKAFQPTFTCCAAGEQCNVADDKGTCGVFTNPNGTTPLNTQVLLYGGQCPEDGSMPLQFAPGQPVRCSLNNFISGYNCQVGTCVRDLSGNVNSGVCCRSSGCEQYESCSSCVRNEGVTDPATNTTSRVNAPCGWLSQGDLSSQQPRCVSNCYNFPEKSCIIPSDGLWCPKSPGSPNGTNYNTGSCDRRCGLVGTGRSSRITNNGGTVNLFNTTTATACCNKYPGDYCCDAYGSRAANCAPGATQSTICGVPIRGTPNNLYNEPEMPYGGYGMPGYGNGMPGYGMPGYGMNPYQMPFNPYGMAPMPFMPMPMGPYGMYRSAAERDAVAEDKNLYFAPQPFFYPPAAPMAPPPPPKMDQEPTRFVCSCDAGCEALDDCCSDYAAKCIVTTTTGAPVTTTPSAPGTTTPSAPGTTTPAPQ